MATSIRHTIQNIQNAINQMALPYSDLTRYQYRLEDCYQAIEDEKKAGEFVVVTSYTKQAATDLQKWLTELKKEVKDLESLVY